MGASQSTGLALGTEDMIRKISKQSFVGYEGRRVRGIGRPHKVDRQEMVGVVAAVRNWMTINHEERLIEIETRSQKVIDILSDTPAITSGMINNIIGHQPFGVELRIDEEEAGMTLQEIVDTLKKGDPPIWTRAREGDDYIAIHMFGLKIGEEELVAERIRELFS
jgi:seryl-tRNA(Sec) selenium transferase